jgi:hypothetical protein
MNEGKWWHRSTELTNSGGWQSGEEDSWKEGVCHVFRQLALGFPFVVIDYVLVSNRKFLRKQRDKEHMFKDHPPIKTSIWVFELNVTFR